MNSQLTDDFVDCYVRLPTAIREQARRAYPLYRQTHVQRAMAMVLKAIGLQPQGWLNNLLTRIGLWFLSRNAAKLAEQGA